VPNANGALNKAIVVISDLVEDHPRFPLQHPALPPLLPHSQTAPCPVAGGYLERLPLAAVRNGLAEFAEIWHHHRDSAIASERTDKFLTRRAFPVSSDAPFHSDAMVEFIAEHGAPRILCVWGLGVSEAILEACAHSTIIYNSIDVPALRVPPHISARFDLVLTGAQWQSDDVTARHHDMLTAILPIGPEFASPETFFPLPEQEKRFDVVYVAAAQPYKRHDILFDALERCPRRLKALCIIGYGEDGDRLRQEATARQLDIEFVGPPGVSYAEVNSLMNQSRVGVVCGVDDGAPAILTEYMLAGLPVVANADLRCGLQYIRPQTGIVAPADRFELGLLEALARTDFKPREFVLENWSWPCSIARLATLLGSLNSGRLSRQDNLEFV
jgi:glycosyltransferase involved in cell wall biosynthesis